MLLGKLRGLLDHAAALAGGGREDDLRAKEAQQPAAFDAEALRHDDHQRIALLRAHHRQPDAGVAARRLHHGLARLQPSVTLRRLDDAERDAVLDRSERIEGLDLDEHLDALRRQMVDAHHGGIADGGQNGGADGGHDGSVSFSVGCQEAVRDD